MTTYPVTATAILAETAQIVIGDPCPDPDSVIAPAQNAVTPYSYTGDSPKATFAATPFDVVPSICTVTYSCSILNGPFAGPCAFVSGTTVATFDSSTGNFSFSSIDTANYSPGLYSFEITGTVGTKSDKVIISVELIGPCSTAEITLLPSPVSDDTYILRDPLQTQTWSYTDVLTIDTGVDCGPITVEFFNEDATFTNLDAALFDDGRDPNSFAVRNTDDVTKAGSYPISYKAYHTNFPSNFKTKTVAFTITVIDPCNNPAGLLASAPADQSYTIT